MVDDSQGSRAPFNSQHAARDFMTVASFLEGKVSHTQLDCLRV